MDDKIYVFEKNKVPYIIYSEKYTKVTSYIYDSVTNMILLNTLDPDSPCDGSGNLRFNIRGLKKTHSYENRGCRREVYTSYNIGNFQSDYYNLPSFFKSSPIATKRYEDTFIYTFIPDTKKGTLQAYAVNKNGLIDFLGEEKIRYLYSCVGVVALDKPQFITSKIIKIPIVILFEDEFMIYNFYTST
uniref:Astacin domain-containing protein n=1 Tax=Strongyloides papillosus TaxID=174720 RepID=A0A0N5BJQ2_STREA